MSIKRISTSAICIALAQVASLVSIYRFPFGGSVTLFSMLIIILPAWIYGVGAGVVCGFVYGLIQFLLEPCFISVLQVMLDYFLAFSVMGIAGLFSKQKNGLIKGYVLAVLARWIIATFAGLAWVQAGCKVWDGFAPLPYSMIYNGIYIFAEAIITMIVLNVPPVKKVLNLMRQNCQ